MRPLRLVIDGFGSYREPADLILSDVEFFVLTGPTGSGKSTVIDALCFALYGTVPRWGKENVIRNALAPSTSGCRVCLVFEVSGRRYVVVRRLVRNARGVVHTKEARLERLDDSVPVETELDRLLEASAQQLAEGPAVTAAVVELLGIGYEHFTQCVLLPQGRFAEFLNAKPSDRQDLLIELLAYAVYEDVGHRARERGKLAAGQVTVLTKQLDDLGEVTPKAIEAAGRRVTDLAGLAPTADAAVAALAELRDKWTETNRQASRHREHLADLTQLRMPADVPDLAARLATADDELDKRSAEQKTVEVAEAEAEQRCEGLTELSTLQAWRDAHRRHVTLHEQLTAVRLEHEAARSTEDDRVAELAEAERVASEAQSALTRAEQEHRAVALAADLQSGEPCPVCRQEVGEVPHHELPADLGTARANLKAAKASITDAGKRLTAARTATATARTKAAGMEEQLAELSGVLAGASKPDEIDIALAAREAADTALAKARAGVRAARAAVATAQREREELRADEQRAWSALRAGRDRFVALCAPVVDGSDLAAAWQTLLSWAQDQQVTLAAAADELDATEKTLRDQGKAGVAELIGLLAQHDVVVDEPAKAPVALATHRERAAQELDRLRSRQKQATALRAEIARSREEHEVADMLGNLLRSDGFERWLCAEALDLLVLEASETLMQLTGEQYELDRGERNEFVVIDHNDAGARRPVNTLSGGETFQASLALALALAHQVMSLSGGKRSLKAMFLDEGFGTLDEVTLDTVASTLERLVEQTGSMIGIVTHVPALAERVPVQFAVTRVGVSSRVERVSV